MLREIPLPPPLIKGGINKNPPFKKGGIDKSPPFRKGDLGGFLMLEFQGKQKNIVYKMS